MHEYETLCYIRDQEVDGVGPWYWLKEDTGAWDGPKRDWEESHKEKWLKHVTNWDVCVQAGGCLGMYPRLLSKHFTNVYSFEPDALNFYVMGLNCQSDHIHRFQAAVGLSSGTFTGVLRSHADNVGMHKTGGQGTVPIFAIDSLGLPECGLLALDIEGYEYFAVQGAMETIKRCSPVVTLECPSTQTRELMTQLGYAADCVSVSDTVFIRA